MLRRSHASSRSTSSSSSYYSSSLSGSSSARGFRRDTDDANVTYHKLSKNCDSTTGLLSGFALKPPKARYIKKITQHDDAGSDAFSFFTGRTTRKKRDVELYWVARDRDPARHVEDIRPRSYGPRDPRRESSEIAGARKNGPPRDVQPRRPAAARGQAQPGPRGRGQPQVPAFVDSPRGANPGMPAHPGHTFLLMGSLNVATLRGQCRMLRMAPCRRRRRLILIISNPLILSILLLLGQAGHIRMGERLGRRT